MSAPTTIMTGGRGRMKVTYLKVNAERGGRAMPGYKHPCRYCNQLIPPDSNVCPLCGKVNPAAPRCPKCRSPVEKGWMGGQQPTCSHCGLSLTVACPECSQASFLDDYCEHCGARLIICCQHCHAEIPPVGDRCLRCGKALPTRKGLRGGMP